VLPSPIEQSRVNTSYLLVVLAGEGRILVAVAVIGLGLVRSGRRKASGSLGTVEVVVDVVVVKVKGRVIMNAVT